MSKGKKRSKAETDARERREKRMQSGGKSKYAKKRILNARGRYSKTSPFYVSPKQEAEALAVGASAIDAEGRPILPYKPAAAAIARDEKGVPHVTLAVPAATTKAASP